MLADGALPSSDDLDRRAPLSFSSASSSKAQSPAAEAQQVHPAGPVGHEGIDVLGCPAGGCPADGHARMLQLFAKGGIPLTSVQMRLKHKPTPGESYKLPDSLMEEFSHGYISPNLNAPPGFKWIRRGVGWLLVPVGG